MIETIRLRFPSSTGTRYSLQRTLRRIEQHPDRTILHPANATYVPMEFAPARITIPGVVAGVIRSYR